MPLVQPMSFIRPQWFDTNGDPVANGFLYTYIAGTNTPQATYNDHTGGAGALNPNPVLLDSGGYADVWLTADSYKLVLEDANHVQLWSIDGVPGLGSLISVGDLSPLFTSVLAGGALNFTLDDAAPGTLFGRFAGTTGPPSFGAIGSDAQITYNNGGQMAGATQVTYDDTPAAEFLRVVNRIKFNTGASPAEIQDNVSKFNITCQSAGQINLGNKGNEPERFVVGPVNGEFQFGVASGEAILKLNDGTSAAGVFSGPHIVCGTVADPNGVITAPQGSLFVTIGGGAGTTLWVKEGNNAPGNIDWVGK